MTNQVVRRYRPCVAFATYIQCHIVMESPLHHDPMFEGVSRPLSRTGALTFEMMILSM
jgi:hypothetical protein